MTHNESGTPSESEHQSQLDAYIKLLEAEVELEELEGNEEVADAAVMKLLSEMDSEPTPIELYQIRQRIFDNLGIRPEKGGHA